MPSIPCELLPNVSYPPTVAPPAMTRHKYAAGTPFTRSYTTSQLVHPSSLCRPEPVAFVRPLSRAGHVNAPVDNTPAGFPQLTPIVRSGARSVGLATTRPELPKQAQAQIDHRLPHRASCVTRRMRSPSLYYLHEQSSPRHTVYLPKKSGRLSQVRARGTSRHGALRRSATHESYLWGWYGRCFGGKRDSFFPHNAPLIG